MAPTGTTAGTVTDTGISTGVTTESRGTEITGVYVPVVPVEMGATTTGASRHSEAHHEGAKKPMGEKIKEKIPGENDCCTV
jgi:hypothetical protein